VESTIGLEQPRASQSTTEADIMEFLVAFDIDIPGGTARTVVEDRKTAEAAAAARLVEAGHLVRVWRRQMAPGGGQTLGLYRAGSEAELDGLLDALPLREWMHIDVTPLEPHPNDPANASPHAA
jgi:muconolactone D-isomerase